MNLWGKEEGIEDRSVGRDRQISVRYSNGIGLVHEHLHCS